jgi:hypothetical protein
MICGDVSSVGGQSSADESDSTMSLAANVRQSNSSEMNVHFIYLDEFNTMG